MEMEIKTKMLNLLSKSGLEETQEKWCHHSLQGGNRKPHPVLAEEPKVLKLKDSIEPGNSSLNPGSKRQQRV